MKKTRNNNTNHSNSNISLEWLDGWLSYENGLGFTPSSEYSSDDFYDYVNGYEANLNGTETRGSSRSEVTLTLLDVMSSWSIAGRFARFHNMDGEPPITISAQEKQQWKTGYRLASDIIASRGSI